MGGGVNIQNVQTMQQQTTGAGNGKQLPDSVKYDAINYKTLLTKIMHSKENRANVIQALSSYSDPNLAVPAVAMMITDQADKIAGQPVPNDIKMGLSPYLVTDLIALGQASKLWGAPTEEDAKAIYQDTVQDYIQRGLADGTIDPIELQAQAEPLMPADVRKEAIEKGGVPTQPDPRAQVAMMKQQAQKQGAAQAIPGGQQQ